MISAKDTHIDTLKTEIEAAKQAKKEADNDIRRLQDQIVELQKDHNRVMLETNKVFAATVAQMNADMREMMTMMFKEFREMIRDMQVNNNKQFDKMMAQFERQDKRIGDILMRMDDRLAKLEDQKSNRLYTGDDGAYDPAVGLELHRMAMAYKEEIAARNGFGQGHFTKIAPFIRTVVVALDAAVGYSAAGAIGQ